MIVLGTALLALAGCSLDAGHTDAEGPKDKSVSVRLEGGQPGDLHLLSGWQEAGPGLDLAPDEAQVTEARADFAPDSSLRGLILQAEAGRRLLTLGWSGGDEASVVLTGSLVRVSDGIGVSLASMDWFLSVVDEVSRSNILAQLPAPEDTSYFQISPYPGQGQERSVPRTASAFVWEGGRLVSLSPDDPRRSLWGSSCVSVYPAVPAGETALVETQEGSVATGTWKSAAPTFVVIPQG